jgi:hypothetical protein
MVNKQDGISKPHTNIYTIGSEKDRHALIELINQVCVEGLSYKNKQLNANAFESENSIYVHSDDMSYFPVEFITKDGLPS